MFAGSAASAAHVVADAETYDSSKVSVNRSVER